MKKRNIRTEKEERLRRRREQYSQIGKPSSKEKNDYKGIRNMIEADMLK